MKNGWKKKLSVVEQAPILRAVSSLCESMFLSLTSISRLRSSLVPCFCVPFFWCWALALARHSPTSRLPLVKVLVTYHSLSGNTERMAEAVVDGVKSVSGAEALLKRVGKVTADDLFSADAVVVGSPVYWSNMSGEVKTFFDNWQFKFGVFPEFKMKNKIGAAFATGGQVSSGKEVTMLTILAAMLGNQMIVVSGGGAFGASATTEGETAPASTTRSWPTPRNWAGVWPKSL